jgi:cold shock CspA family protein
MKPLALSKKPEDLRGRPASGTVVNIRIGQSHGFIRLSDARQIYFHRADLQEGTSFNDLAIGQKVTFEILEDRVSGARALRVRRPSRALTARR